MPTGSSWTATTHATGTLPLGVVDSFEAHCSLMKPYLIVCETCNQESHRCCARIRSRSFQTKLLPPFFMRYPLFAQPGPSHSYTARTEEPVWFISKCSDSFPNLDEFRLRFFLKNEMKNRRSQVERARVWRIERARVWQRMHRPQ